MACAPVLASATIVMSAAILMEVCNPMRTMKWSSTIRIRIFFFMLTRRNRRGRGCQRHAYIDSGARAGLAENREAAADFFSPLAHSQQTKVTRFAGRCVLRIEADSVILDRKLNQLPAILQR